jgi:hypothetical protein
LKRTVRNEDKLANAKFSAFAGWELTGWPILTIRRGEVVYEGGKILAGGQRPIGAQAALAETIATGVCEPACWAARPKLLRTDSNRSLRNATGLWTRAPKFRILKIIEQRLAPKFAIFGARRPTFLARDRTLHR